MTNSLLKKVNTFPYLDFLRHSPNNGEPERRSSNGEETEYLLSELGENIIGNSSGFGGIAGWTKYTYLDHTASGKSVKWIEDFIHNNVLPNYANTHTTVSYTSLQTTKLRTEARSIIKQSVGASDQDEVIFCGSGATSAVHKLLHCLSHGNKRKLFVFVGPLEHHSNMLPWRESANAKAIQVPLDKTTGQVDKNFLKKQLQQLKKATKWTTKNHLIVGCFSAGSNINGALTDDVELTKLMHEFGGLAVWDYAAAAPHVDINMNPVIDNPNSFSNKDALFFSGHKFLGGPQTPGILVIKKRLLQNPVPHGVGGGTVLFTTKRTQQYLEDFTEREEGGTPDIIGSIRLGLVFSLRNAIGIQKIMEKEAYLCRKILEGLKDCPEIVVLESGERNNPPRLPIIAFMIKNLKTGYFLHHNFLVALLNDLFGIQCRGGCMCAGPYSQALLGMNDDLINLLAKQLLKIQTGSESEKAAEKYGMILKPGFARISVNFHNTDKEVQFVINAVKLIAKYGWRLLPYYKINMETASFTSNYDKESQLASLNSFVNEGVYAVYSRKANLVEDTDKKAKEFSYENCLKNAKKLMKLSESTMHKFLSHHSSNGNQENVKIADHKLRWFMLPQESIHLLLDEYYRNSPFSEPQGIKSSLPFKPMHTRNRNTFDQNQHWSKGSIPWMIQEAWNKPRFYDGKQEMNTLADDQDWFNADKAKENLPEEYYPSRNTSFSSGFCEFCEVEFTGL